MIFRTITDDITGANKSIGLFGLSLQNVKNKLQEIQAVGFKNAIFNSSTIDTSAIIAYNNEISKGATAQQALATASRNTNRATIALMESANGATISTEQMTAAQKASTVAAKAQSVAYKAVSIAANMIAYALIAKGLQLAADAIDHYVNRAKYAAEAMEEAQQAIDDAQSSLKNVFTTLSENKDRFLELSQGVDKFSKNLSLSEEDYAEYLSISNQLAELSPSLVSGYDEQGNALLAIGKNADETNEKLQSVLENQQAIAQQTLIDNMDDVATGIYYEVEDAKSSIESMETELASLQDQFKEVNVDIASSNGLISFSDDDYSKYGKAMENALTSAGIEFEKNASAGLYTTAIQLVSASPQQLEQAQKFYDAWLNSENEYYHASENGLKQDIEEKEKSIETSYAKMTANLQAWVKDNYNYQYLSDDASAMVDALIPEIKWDELEEAPITASDYQNYVEENIIKPLMEVPQEHKQEIDNMLQQLLSFEDGDLDVLEFAEQLQARLKELGITIDITPIIADEQEAKDKLQNSIEAIAEGGSSDFTTSSGVKVDADDYKTLQEYTKDFTSDQIELWNKSTLGAENATDAINKYEEALKSASNPDEITVSFIDTLNSADYTEIKDELLELAKSGEITPETLSSTEEYAELLSKTETSAESATNQILDMLSAQEKLSGFSQGLNKLKSAYEEFKDEDIGFVTAETLQSLPDAFKNLPEFDLFSQIVGDPTSGAGAIQQAFNDIVKAYMLSQDTLQGLVGASEHDIQSYIANLKQMGVTNAEEVVNIAMQALNSENELLNAAESEYIEYLKHKDDYDTNYLENVASKNGQLASKLGEAYKADYNNWCDLLTKKAELYNEFIERIGGSYNAAYSATGNMANNGMNMSVDNIAKAQASASAYYQSVYKAEQAKNQLKLNLAPINTNFGTSFSPSGSGSNGGSNGGSNDTVNTETYDWIEKKLEAIAKKTEKAGEAFEKAFSLSSTNKKYKKYLSQINTEISANNSAIQTYQAKLNSIGLSADWIAKIQNGEYSITDVTDDALNERIGLYKEYYDKLESCQETVKELQEKRLEVQNQYAEKVIGIYEREIEKLDRIIEKREALIELKESFVGYASKSDLKYEQKYYQKELNSLEEQNDKLIKLRKTVKKNGDAWNTYTEKINENKSSILDLTQSIAELAEKLANLPLEKLERKLDKNDTKRSLNDAKLSNATSVGAKNSILNSQISLENSDNKATQTYAKETTKAVTTNIKSIKSAKNSDKKGLSKKEKKKVDSYYKQIQKYTKSKKSIPASLITKLANAGYSNLVQACSNYNESLDANKTAQETVKLTAEQTKANINELKKQQFDNIQEDYSRKASQIQAKADNVDSKIALLEAKGYMSSASWYNDVIKYEQQNLANSQAELKALKAKQNEMTKYTDEWWEAQDAIDSVTQSINESTLALQEYVNTMREIRLENFEFLQGQISRLNSEAEYFIDLMQNMELSGDNGLTYYGLTAMGMYYQQIQTNLEMAEKYANMAKEIEQQLIKEPYNTDLLTKYQELADKQREMITNNESLKKSIADLVKDGYDALLDSLGEVIDKYKEVLNSAKDAHDYQKNIYDKTENINTLQKQIVAFSGMTGNDEVASKLQSLQAELKDAEEDLQETMYDKYISDTEEILDEILNELETFIEELSKNTNELYEEGVKQIASNTSSIYDTLQSLVGTSDTPLSEQMESIWDSESITDAIKDSALSGEDITNPITTAIQDAVSSIVSAINRAELESDKQTDITAFNEIAAKYDGTDYDSHLGNVMSKLNDANNALTKVSNASIGLPTLDEINKQMKQLDINRQEVQYKHDTAPTNTLRRQYSKQILDIDEQLYYLGKTRDKVIQSGKELEKIQQTINSLNREIDYIGSAHTKATENNKSVIKELLTSISNPYSLTGTDQTELDKKVSEIVGTTSYLSDFNVEQLAKLFGVQNNQNAILLALKNAGFATGGIAKAVGEDGIALVRNGEGFVMPEHVPMIQGLLDSVPKIDALINTTLPNLPSNRGGDIAQTIEIGDIYMSGVNDPQEFSKQLINSVKNDSKVQKTFGTFVNNSLTGKNSLGIRKY